MTPDIARMALQFMQRVQLQGTEVPAFNAVCSELQAQISHQNVVDKGQQKTDEDKQD